MLKTVKIYLYLLPIYSLIGVLLSIFRTAFQDNYASAILLVGALMDTALIFAARKFLFRKELVFIFILLAFSVIVGNINGNELSRRYITDFTNPFFFFCKIFIFSYYWQADSFTVYTKYYVRVAFLGSLFLLPITYYLFYLSGIKRLAIFPPMELPFSYYMQGGGVFLLLSFLIILLYGKRAQFLGAALTYLFFVLFFKSKELLKHVLVTSLLIFALYVVIKDFNENYAISRLLTTFEVIQEGGLEQGSEKVSAGRYDEIEAVLERMEGIDFILGKGFGFTYVQEVNDGLKETANVHFSPLGLLSKYGLIFTFYIYSFILYYLFTPVRNFSSTAYVSAFSSSLFIFIESFFSYALFVLPLFPVCFGYLVYLKKRNIS